MLSKSVLRLIILAFWLFWQNFASADSYLFVQCQHAAQWAAFGQTSTVAASEWENFCDTVYRDARHRYLYGSCMRTSYASMTNKLGWCGNVED